MKEICKDGRKETLGRKGWKEGRTSRKREGKKDGSVKAHVPAPLTSAADWFTDDQT